METSILVGKIITRIDLDADRLAIKFTLSDGSTIIAQCDADCCSHTWIEDVINPEAALDSEVLVARDVDLPEEFQTPTKTGNGEDEMQYYGFEILTARGKFLIAYRNSSNGYYGGSLCWPGDCSFYGGVYGQQEASYDWKQAVGN